MRHGTARSGMDRYGRQGGARSVAARTGPKWRGMAWQARRHMPSSGLERQGSYGTERPGVERRGAARQARKGASSPAPTVVPAKSKKVPVALRFDSDLLSAIDAMAARRGMSRNAIISYWCSKGVESE